MEKMTAEAKIPETSTNWRSIDVYLFSNGQQFSPPRKYHLHSDELTWWKATLMHLARLHYGSLHSCIELYTLEGHKIDSPLEIINGNAYVAVEPPDLFIDSGYSKYMIKASRSWEKSQARKIISNEITKSDECNNESVISTSNKVTDHMPIKISNEHATTEMVQMHPVKTINTITKPDACIDNSSLKSFTALLKEKERDPYSQNPPVITKLSNSATLSSKTRDLTVKNNKNNIRKANSKVQYLQRNETVGSNNKLQVIKKIPSTPYKFKTPFSVPSKMKRMSTDSPKHPSKKMLTKLEKNNISPSDIQADVSIFDNVDSELPSVMVVLEGDPSGVDKKQIRNVIKEKCDIFEPIPEEVVGEVKNNGLKESLTTHRDEFKTSGKIFIESIQHEPNVTFSEKKIEENSLIINKGDIINLKLHIEVQKEENRNRDNKLVKRSQSLTNIFKDEKASQINLDDELFIQSKTESKKLHSFLISELNRNIIENESSDLVIVKCDCCAYCSYDLSNHDALLSQNVNRKYFVLIPTGKHNEQIQRCQCEREDNEELESVVKNKEQVKSSIIYNSLKKAISELSLERLPNTDPETIILITDEGILNAENKLYNSDNNEQNEHTVTETEDDGKTKSIITRKHTEVPPKIVSDKSIQTECSNLLLQARRQHDGHYTFHLPPLDLLKYYKIS